MESLSKLEQQFRRLPAANNGDTIREVEPDVSSILAEPDGNPEKPAQSYEVGGIAKLEAAKAVWGRTGKYIFFILGGFSGSSSTLCGLSIDLNNRLGMMMIIL
jgi:hypothetical protein